MHGPHFRKPGDAGGQRIEANIPLGSHSHLDQGRYRALTGLVPVHLSFIGENPAIFFCLFYETADFVHRTTGHRGDPLGRRARVFFEDAEYVFHQVTRVSMCTRKGQRENQYGGR